MNDPFKTAERYLQLKKQCVPQSWGDIVIRLNEMLLAPVLAFFFAFMGSGGFMKVISAATTAHKAWSEWIEYQELRFSVQRMYLLTMAVGGPFISTNDPEYQPYVYADAVVRAQTGMLTKSGKPPQR
jgi:hypothetical protein